MAKSKPRYKRVAQLKSFGDFKDYLQSLKVDIPAKETLDQPAESSLNRPFTLSSGKRIGNRFCILPMEGWDGTNDGKPTEHTKRRWHHFAISGAKMLWGCEAVAVRADGRANPHQLLMNGRNLDAFKRLFQDMIKDHEQRFHHCDDLLVGLQLTHSGRFSQPEAGKARKPKILYRHPLLDHKFGIADDHPLLTDSEVDQLIDDFVKAAGLSHEAGFQFIDIKHCHGYLGHEFLSAYGRKGKYGGSLKNRMRFLESIIDGVRASCNLPIGVRLSAFDWIPFRTGPDGIGVPENEDPYGLGFGGDNSGTGIDLSEVEQMLKRLQDLKIELLCITAGSPYYVPHIQRPALFPPSDGYLPPEDPLVGVARQIKVTGLIKHKFPDIAIVGSAYSYLQEWLPNVAEAVVEQGMTDFVGLGRMILSYPEMAADILKGNQLDRTRICRTFSDCTTGPRQGLISGCFPLDPYYKALPDAAKLKELKSNLEL